ncbi:acyltransferase family protein [Streptomyces sp. NPDC060053]|uniref:acyltransferase family protein n=1 Tax=Streptomyces sp. NPDC060053 TaxID=3347047 RepID=UPI0036B1D92F
MPPTPAPNRDRLPSLTGLRFWAALLVVLYHLSRQVGIVPGVSDVVWYGRSGVTFFFVLSGVVLAWTYDGAGVSA